MCNVNELLGFSINDIIQVQNANEKLQLTTDLFARLESELSRIRRRIAHFESVAKELKNSVEFVTFCQQHEPELLDLHIDEAKCAAVADVLHNIRVHYGDEPFAVTLDTANLPPEAIAQVRYFTANQDFRLPLGAQFSKYREDCSQFDAATIYQRPVGFLEYFELTGASQSDKRADYAKNVAKLLIDRGIDAFDLAEHCDNDAVKIRRLLTETPNIGYGDKKANMFIRDMWSLGVWTGLQNIDKIDVASDVNTMKVALRTGIVKTAI